MKNAMNPMKMLLFTIVFLSVSASFALAVPISGYNGIEGLGSFEGDFSFTVASDSSATIDIILTNTSPLANGGYLTAFAFLFPDINEYNVESFSSTAPNFELLEGPIQASPYDDFDLGGSVSDQWLGMSMGSQPSDGLGVGDTGEFEYILSGSGFSGLSEQSFFDAGDPWFAARFMGFEDGGSDKVPAQPVPEPAVMLLLGLGLAGIASLTRTRFIR